MVNNTTLTGWLFTDQVGTIEKNQTIDPSGSTWLIVTDSGIYQIQEPFVITDLRTLSGQPLNNTTLYAYTSAQTDVSKIYEELEQIRQLWQEYLEMSTTAGGGSREDWEDTINWLMGQWWFWVFVGIGAIVLIGRSFGRGGVSVIKLGK